MQTKLCTGCSKDLLLSAFSMHSVRGRKYLRSQCQGCITKNPATRESHKLWMKASRRNPEHRARHILDDCRKIDKRHGLKCDLDVEFINRMIHTCLYCGVLPSEVMITLDRIDNSIGHIKSNVVPSCIDCNLTRGTMPFSAWMEIAPVMRQLREKGALIGWHQRSSKKY